MREERIRDTNCVSCARLGLGRLVPRRCPTGAYQVLLAPWPSDRLPDSVGAQVVPTGCLNGAYAVL